MRKSANWLRIVPLKESHLPTAGLPYCAIICRESGIQRMFSQVFLERIPQRRGIGL
jgi:hypothetical protein